MTEDSKAARKAARQARLVQAMASTPTRTRGGRADTELKAAARMAAHELKLAAAADALAQREEQERAEQRQRFDRLAEIGKLIGTAKHAIADLDARLVEAQEAGDVPAMGSLMAARLNWEQRVESIKLEQSVLYGQPIHPSDLGGSGRFMRSIRWHAREVVNSHQSIRAEDILSEALVLCYMHPDELVEVTRGYDSNGRPIVDMFPSIGELYRNIKRAYRDQLDQFRQIKRGLVGVRSLDELAAAGIEPTPHFEHYGVQMVDPAEMDWDAIATGRQIALNEAGFLRGERYAGLEESRWAMIDDDQRARRAKAEREAAEAARAEMVSRASAPLGSSKAERADFEVDRILIEGLIDGETLADLAADLGVTVDTLTRRLAGRDLTVGIR